MRTLGKRVMQQCIRGFESLSVRHLYELSEGLHPAATLL